MSRKSLVYLDDVVQRILKDVLIPTVGFRDTSLKFGDYTTKIDTLDQNFDTLNIPPKSKLFIHNSMSQPINIVIPQNKYGSEGEPACEPIVVSIDLSHNGNTTLSTMISIPIDCSGGGLPYCISANKPAHDVLKKIQVKEMSSVELTPSRVVQIYFPEINVDTSGNFGRAVVTIYSENRNVDVTNKWDDVVGTESHVTINHSNTVDIGTVPYFDPIDKPEELIRSETITHIESVSAGTYQYLTEVNSTDPNTIYMEREDEKTNRSGRIVFKTLEQIQRDKDIILEIFGNDWSELEIVFDDTITDISGAFKTFTINSTPKKIIGQNVIHADSLFEGSTIRHITNQQTLLADMPKLQTINRMFKDTPLQDEIKLELISSNLRLLEMNHTFENTKITNSYEFWNHTIEYTPERDPETSSLLPNPSPVSVLLEGNGCFQGVTTLPPALEIPAEWKQDNNSRRFSNIDEFKIKRSSLLNQFDNDLSLVTINILEENQSLDGMFSRTKLRKGPLSVIAPNATSIKDFYSYCPDLVKIYASSIAQLTTVTSAENFITGCEKLTSIESNIFAPHKLITNYRNALSGLTSITGQTPTVDGKQLWELAGTEGYPEYIDGSSCFQDSTFDNIGDVPVEWGGEQNV